MRKPNPLTLYVSTLQLDNRLLLNLRESAASEAGITLQDLRRALKSLQVPHIELQDPVDDACIAFWITDYPRRMDPPIEPGRPRYSGVEDALWEDYDRRLSWYRTMVASAAALPSAQPLTNFELVPGVWLVNPQAEPHPNPAIRRLQEAETPVPPLELDMRGAHTTEDDVCEAAYKLKPRQGARVLLDGPPHVQYEARDRLMLTGYSVTLANVSGVTALDIWRSATASTTYTFSEKSKVYQELACMLMGEGRSVQLPADCELDAHSLRQALTRKGIRKPAIRTLQDGSTRIWARSVVKTLEIDLRSISFQNHMLTVEEGVPLPKRRNTGAPRGCAAPDPNAPPRPELPTMEVGEVIRYGDDSSAAKSIAARLRFQGYRMRAALGQDDQWYIKRTA